VRRALLTIVVVAALLVTGVLALVALNDDSDTPVAPDRLKGLNLTAYTAEGYADPRVREDLEKLEALGSNAVVLVPTWYMEKADSNEILPDATKTPSDASLEQAIEWAGDQGLKVILKPHVDVADGTFRGDIQPSDRTAWFDSYVEFISLYAGIAGRSGVDMFSVGTELKSMSADTGEWERVIESVRPVFTGDLVYAANWDEFSQIQFWDRLDLIGIDAYFPLSAEGETPTAATLAAAWKPNVDALEALSIQWGLPVLLTEIGYPTQAGATAHPWEVREGEPPDQAAQAQAYEAAFAAFEGKDWLDGILWWSWRADQTADEDPETDYSPEGKEAERVLAGNG
jgi:hypothetical protein